MIRFTVFLCLYFFCLSQIKAQESEDKRYKYLIELKEHLDLKGYGGTMVNHLDSTWQDWLKRTGDLPPDFSLLPSIPNLPNPFVLDEGINNRPVVNSNEWEEKKLWIREQYQQWVLGHFPPKPELIKSEILLDSIADNGIRVQEIKLVFGENQNAVMRFKLFIPPGNGKKAVFMTQSTHERWAYIAVRRGYIGCVYAGGDVLDDTRNYQEVFSGYDFSTLARRAWGASRVLDYLFTLEYVDTEKIAITGHSRNGKQAMIAGAFDERFTAIIASTGSIGGGLPFRFTDNKFDSESIDAVSKNFPDWFHPRLRFFMGREHKLPVDQNLLAATIAPRAFMFTSGYLEATSNTVGMEEMYKSLHKVYTFLGEDPGKKLYLRARNGLHNISARDVEAYIDFLDRVFFDKNIPELTYHYNNFDFHSWKDSYLKIYNDTLAPFEFHKTKERNTYEANSPKSEIKKNLLWALGEEPPGVYNAGPKNLNNSRNAEDWVYRLMRARDEVVNEFTGKMLICPYNSMGDYQFADLYYPKNSKGEVDLSKGKLPVFILQHSNSTATGYRWNIAPFIHELTRNGIAVMAYDQIGFGTRVEEGTLFYNRYPVWSKMGKMVSDVSGAIDALENFDIIDDKRIYIGGNNLGASVSLIAAALDSRINGVFAYSGFSPWRLENRTDLGLYEFSHMFGLLPKLGFYENRITELPIDWDDIISLISPRQLTLIAPKLDRHLDQSGVIELKNKIENIYLKVGKNKFQFIVPQGFNQWDKKQQIDMASRIIKSIKYEN